MKTFAAAFGLTVACTLLVPAPSADAARSNSQAAPARISLRGNTGSDISLSAASGAAGETVAHITNEDSITHVVTLALGGSDDAATWWTLADTVIDLAARASQDVALRVRVPEESTAGRHSNTLMATADNAPTIVASVPLTLAVQGPSRGALSIESLTISKGGSNKVDIVVKNRGNVDVHASGTLRVEGNPSVKDFAVSVAAGARSVITVVRPVGEAGQPTAVALQYGQDVANWSGILAAHSSPDAGGKDSGGNVVGSPEGADATVSISPDGGHGLSVTTVLLFGVLLVALCWMLYEVFASKRNRLDDSDEEPAAIVEHESAVALQSAAELGARLEPLVHAIEQLAGAVASGIALPTTDETASATARIAARVHDARGIAGVAPPVGSTPVGSTPVGSAPTRIAPTRITPALASGGLALQLNVAVEALPRPPHVVASKIEGLAAIEMATGFAREVEVVEATTSEGDGEGDDTLTRASLIDAVAQGLGISKMALLKWMPDDVFDRTDPNGEPSPPEVMQRDHRVLELQVAILKRALAHQINPQ